MAAMATRKKTNAQWHAEVLSMKEQLKINAERILKLSAELEDKKTEVHTLRRQVRDLQSDKKDLQEAMHRNRSRELKALECAEEGSTAAGITSRIALRLMDQIDNIQRKLD
jgi:predicted transcriptional regulator